MNIILDMGSGNGRGNDFDYIRKSIDAIACRDTKQHKLYLKYQLFVDAQPNTPLTRESFEYAYNVGSAYGYQVTASVFDVPSMLFLQGYQVPFIKIANNSDLYRLIPMMPYEMIVASNDGKTKPEGEVIHLCCVSEYPALAKDYIKRFNADELSAGISDHTEGFELFNTYQPEWWEKHFVYERSYDNPDAGSFAIGPEDLKDIL